MLLIQTVVIAATRPMFAAILGSGMLAGHLAAGTRQKLAVNLAKALAVGFGMGWNYFMYSKLVFKDKQPTSEPVSGPE